MYILGVRGCLCKISLFYRYSAVKRVVRRIRSLANLAVIYIQFYMRRPRVMTNHLNLINQIYSNFLFSSMMSTTPQLPLSIYVKCLNMPSFCNLAHSSYIATLSGLHVSL